MKKVFLIAMMLLTIIANAQTTIEKGFKKSGTMSLYWETKDVSNISKADKGAKWNIDYTGNDIVFWIDIPSEGLYNLSKTKWNEREHKLIMTTVDGGGKMYVVKDSKYRHLTVMEYEKGKWLVQLCSVDLQL